MASDVRLDGKSVVQRTYMGVRTIRKNSLKQEQKMIILHVVIHYLYCDHLMQKTE